MGLVIRLGLVVGVVSLCAVGPSWLIRLADRPPASEAVDWDHAAYVDYSLGRAFARLERLEAEVRSGPPSALELAVSLRHAEVIIEQLSDQAVKAEAEERLRAVRWRHPNLPDP